MDLLACDSTNREVVGIITRRDIIKAIASKE